MVILETQRLILRQFLFSDADALDDVFGDAEVMRFGPGVQTPAWVQVWLQRCLKDYYQERGFGPWAMVEKSIHEVIGYCGLFYYPDIAGKAEIEVGYRLRRRSWGQGYASEAVLAVRDYAFNVLSLPRLVALIDPANTASIRVAEKAGMRYEYEVLLEGYTHPDRVYSISNPVSALVDHPAHLPGRPGND